MKKLGGGYLNEIDLRDAGFRELGKNVQVHSHAHIYGLENVKLGDNVRIDDFSLLVATGLITVGRNVSIHSHCFIGSKYGVLIGDFVTLAPGVKLFSSSDDYSGEYLTGPTVPKELTGGFVGEIVIGRHSIIGAGSVVLPNVVIGEGVSVGALSLVKSELDEWSIYAGCPVRRLGPRSKALLNHADKYREYDI